MPETPKNEHVSVELLRSWADDEVPWHDAAQIPRGIFVVAADEIERLRAENAALEKYAAELLNDKNLLLLELWRNACPTCGSSLSSANIHFYSPSPTAEG